MAQPHRWPRLFSGRLTLESPSEAICAQPAREARSGFPRLAACDADDSCALRETLDIFDAWSKRFLGVCQMLLGVCEGRTRFADAMDSIAASHWILPELFARLSHCADDGASGGEARRPFPEFAAVARAKGAVEPFLSPARLSPAHADELRDSIAALNVACALFREAVAGRIDSAH
ncbi:hypothetical protein [Caballeronia sp. BR00000012568055]|uniref:hypothetical protein n=1 Tax=Caballeronia sp. BR00000012568055 TaxID=2918761 RepID=UPI0023F8B03C|nr:hypothetical protein [Caballeronia sp. BR00000012568055]